MRLEPALELAKAMSRRPYQFAYDPEEAKPEDFMSMAAALAEALEDGGVVLITVKERDELRAIAEASWRV